MADTTFYRYLDAHGAPHFVNSEADVPPDHRGTVETLTLRHHHTAVEAQAAMSDAVSAMHWPSFGYGLAAAAAVFLVLRVVAPKRIWFMVAASAIAVGGLGSAGYLKRLEKALPSSVTQALPIHAGAGPPTLAEARRILDSLPKAGQDRDKALEKIFTSEK